MKLLGLIGGMSPASTEVYYRLLNKHARDRLGGEHSARLLIFTLDYGVMIDIYQNADWRGYAEGVADAAEHLAAGGAEALVICSNTTHVGADLAHERTRLPVIHVLDVLSRAMNAEGALRPLLLGTPFVMSGDFYLPLLRKRFSGAVATPNETEQASVGRIILDELVNGQVRQASRRELLAMIARHEKAGVDSVILGCTELCLILSEEHCDLPVFDTTALHAQAACRYAFGEA